MLSGWRERWAPWRVPVKTAVLSAIVVALVIGYAWRPRQTWTLGWSGFMRSEDPNDADVLLSSAYRVQLAEHEGATLPVYVSVFRSGSRVPVTPQGVRRAIERAIALREGARWELVNGSRTTAFLLPRPSVTVALDLWSEGGVRGDVELRCLHPRTPGMDGTAMSTALDAQLSSYAAFTSEDDLAAFVSERITRAAGQACPAIPSESAYPGQGGAP